MIQVSRSKRTQKLNKSRLLGLIEKKRTDRKSVLCDYIREGPLKVINRLDSIIVVLRFETLCKLLNKGFRHDNFDMPRTITHEFYFKERLSLRF